jgi:hypothetical protein
MKKFKIFAVIASLLALTGIPGFAHTLPSVADYKPFFAALVVGHAIAGLIIVLGTALLFTKKNQIGKGLVITACAFASYGKVVEGYYYEYPLYLSFRYGSFSGFDSFSNGFSLHIPFVILTAILIYLYQSAYETEAQIQAR